MDPVKQWLSTLEKLTRAHNVIYDQLLTLKEQAPSLSPEQLVDVKHALRRAHEVITSLRKELNDSQEMISHTFCLQYMMLNCEGPVHGTIATGTPQMTMAPTPPRPGSPEYATMMQHFGVSGDAALGVMRPHYPALVEYCTTLAKEGRSLPGIAPDKQRSKYTLVTREKTNGKKD